MEEGHKELTKEANIRFYEQEYPNEQDLVMVKIKDVSDFATIVILLEYGDKEGIITSNEYTRHSRRQKLVKARKVGKIEACLAIRVDEEGGYIDLSKKRVQPSDIAGIEDKYAKGKAVQAIMHSVVEKTNTNLEELYRTVVWPLQKKYPHALDAFTDALNDFDKAFEGIEMNESVKEKLAAEIGRRLTPQPVKISAYFEVNCFAKEGVDAIKEALREAEALSTPDIKISVNLITPPMFSVSTMALLNKKKAFELIETSLKVIEEGIKKRGGSYKLKKAPQRVDKNEKEVEERLLEDEDANDGEQYQFEDDEDN